MARYQTFFNVVTRYRLGLACLLLITLVCAAFGFTGNDDFAVAKQEILLRKIGHEILLHSGDTTSRVLPVRKVAADEYHIRFENEFTFQSDSLVQIIRRSLEKDPLSKDYIVNVVSCSGKDVLFGYAILDNQQNNIIPCSGRKQPKGCYLVDIKFQGTKTSILEKGYLVGGLSLFAFIGLLVAVPFRIRKKTHEETVVENDVFHFGNTFFDPNKMQVITGGITTELTPKENELLRIFASAPDLIIERSRLQKEIWEDEGVIVGRSLDVFISRLRKKLEKDPLIQLRNVHGKGYKLETGESSVANS